MAFCYTTIVHSLVNFSDYKGIKQAKKHTTLNLGMTMRLGGAEVVFPVPYPIIGHWGGAEIPHFRARRVGRGISCTNTFTSQRRPFLQSKTLHHHNQLAPIVQRTTRQPPKSTKLRP